jgi:probable HAF family extracellular repeat protein
LDGFNWHSTKAQFVSDDGNVVGGNATNNSNRYEGFRWTQGTGITSLGYLPGGNMTQAMEMSADGSVFIGGASNSLGNNEAFRWTENGGLQGLGFLNTLVQGVYTSALTVSDDGSRVTLVGANAYGNIQFGFWTPSSGITSPEVLSSDMSTNVIKINADGTAITGSHGQNGPDQAFVWTQAHGLTDIGALYDPTLRSEATDMNSDGTVVVGWAHDINIVQHAFRWTQSGGFVNLGLLSGGNYSQSSFVSQDGNVAVGIADDATYSQQAFRWTQGSGMVGLGVLPGATYSQPNALNADGSVVIGVSDSVPNGEGFRWTQGGGMVGLGLLAGGSYSNARLVSDDGSVVAGEADDASNHTEVFRWTQGGGMAGLGFLAGGTTSSLGFLTSDGAAIVGTANDNTGNYQAFRWTQGSGMQGLGLLTGGSYSSPTAINHDASAVVGFGDDVNGNQQAFRWMQSTGIQGLGFLSGGNYSAASGVNADGSIVVGYGNDINGNQQAFRWMQSTGMQGLGFLTTNYVGANSFANSMNIDGSIIVGNADSHGGQEAFIWTPGDGMKTLNSVLQNKGVDTTGWHLDDANHISADGRIVFGQATVSGNTYGYIADLYTGGVITPEILEASLASVAQTSQQVISSGVSQLQQSLFTARNLSSFSIPVSSPVFTTSNDPYDLSNVTTAAGGVPQPLKSKWSMYTMGSFGLGQGNDYNNHDLNGTLGVNAQVTDNMSIGVGIIQSNSRSDLAFSGESRMDATGGSLITAYEHPKGLRLYGTAFASAVNVDMSRGYMNGASLDGSQGETSGLAYGVAGQVGWSFHVSDKDNLMPYSELRWSKTKLDAYTETGGAFPASYGSQDYNSTSMRLGFQNDYQLTPQFDFTSRLAWGHRLDSGKNSITATAAGLTQSLGVSGGDKNWFEGAVGGGWQATDTLRLNGEVSARSGDTAEPQVTFMLGAVVSF